MLNANSPEAIAAMAAKLLADLLAGMPNFSMSFAVSSITTITITITSLSMMRAEWSEMRTEGLFIYNTDGSTVF